MQTKMLIINGWWLESAVSVFLTWPIAVPSYGLYLKSAHYHLDSEMDGSTNWIHKCTK